MSEMGKLMEEMTRAGVLISTAGLRPSAEGVRLRSRVQHDVRALGASGVAMPRPMPDVDPVTRAVFPFSMGFPLPDLRAIA